MYPNYQNVVNKFLHNWTSHNKNKENEKTEMGSEIRQICFLQNTKLLRAEKGIAAIEGYLWPGHHFLGDYCRGYGFSLVLGSCVTIDRTKLLTGREVKRWLSEDFFVLFHLETKVLSSLRFKSTHRHMTLMVKCVFKNLHLYFDVS